MSFWKRREESLDAEIQDYLDRQIQEYIAAGMPPAEARQAARRKLGPVLRVKEDTRAAWGWVWLERLWQDLSYARRTLSRSPGFAVIAVISLAIGVGANCAIFSLADMLLLRPLPVPKPSEVVTLGSTDPASSAGYNLLTASYPEYLDLRDRTASFSGVVSYNLMRMRFATQADALPAVKMGMVVSGNFFSALGVEPELGRSFRPDEDQTPGRDPVMNLSHETWEQQFSSDPSILGRKLRLNDIDFTVIGVMPARFTSVDQWIHPAFYVPAMMLPRLEGEVVHGTLDRRDARPFIVKARMKPGITVAQARAEVAAIGASLERTYPDTNRNRRMEARTELQARIALVPPNAMLVAMLATLAAAVLLVACANVAGLLTSRAPARAREIALRLSIGAGRARLIRQLLTESFVLGSAGGVAGLLVGYAGVVLFRQFTYPSDLPVVLSVELDQRALIFSVSVAMLSVILFGLVPALQTTRTDLSSVLKGSGRTASGRRRPWGRNCLVAGQVAVSLTLLTLTTFLYLGFHRSLLDGPGYRIDHLLTMSFDPSLSHYTDQQTQQFYKQLMERARAVTGVRSATLVSYVPMTVGELDTTAILPEGYQLPRGKDNVGLLMNRVDESFFDTMRIPLVRGRGFRVTDDSGAPLVAVVNELLAQHYWPGRDAVGKRFRLERSTGPWVEIVGIAKMSKYQSGTEVPTEFVYLSYRQHPRDRMTLLAESVGPPAALAAPLREVVRGLDGKQPVFDVRTMEEFYLFRSVRAGQVIVQTVGAMGVMGMALAFAGLYGLVSFAVTSRTREIGIRMAIGAGRSTVLRMVLRQGLALAGAGLLAGLILSVGAGRMMQAVFPAGSNDALAYLVVVPAVLAITLLAAYIPARRASRVDPTVALRCE